MLASAPAATGTEPTARLSSILARRIEDGSLDLPVLAEAAQRVMRMALDDTADAGALAEAIKKDSAMASHLLRVANSPLYRGRAPIVSLQQAVSRLGMRQVREIALAIVCESRVFRVRGYEDDLRALFRHSLAAAYFAQEIARVKRANVEEAFLAGLLHDIGRPVLLQTLVDLGRELGERFSREAVLAAVEAHHALAGESLVTRWELGAKLAAAVRDHHAPAGAGLAALSGLADALAHHAVGPRTVGAEDVISGPWAATLNVYPDELAGLVGAVEKIRAAVQAVQ